MMNMGDEKTIRPRAVIIFETLGTCTNFDGMQWDHGHHGLAYCLAFLHGNGDWCWDSQSQILCPSQESEQGNNIDLELREASPPVLLIHVIYRR